MVLFHTTIVYCRVCCSGVNLLPLMYSTVKALEPHIFTKTTNFVITFDWISSLNTLFNQFIIVSYCKYKIIWYKNVQKDAHYIHTFQHIIFIFNINICSCLHISYSVTRFSYFWTHKKVILINAEVLFVNVLPRVVAIQPKILFLNLTD